MPEFRDEILEAVAAADRLHGEFDSRSRSAAGDGRVDVFEMLVRRDIPTLFRPLKGLLGAFLNEGGSTGVMVTTERQLPVQRFTAAHELGHAILGHEASLDDEVTLARMPFGYRSANSDIREIQANAFASELLMPKWLLAKHTKRQAWGPSDLGRPETVYQLSLRLGTSYAATCNTLSYRGILGGKAYSEVSAWTPKPIKQRLARPYVPATWHGDVWVITKKDDGLYIEGSASDIVVFNLAEHSGSGYLWRFDELEAAGLLAVHDERRSGAGPELIGGVINRTVIAAAKDGARGSIYLRETRPWLPSGDALHSMVLDFNLSGPVKGLLPAQREAYLVA